MFVLAKFLTWLASPLAIAMVLGLLACWLAWRGRRRAAIAWLALTAAWLLVWSSPLFYGWFGFTLERCYPPRRAGEMPTADAIVVLGGGMTAAPGLLPYPDMTGGADRVWHAARLYRAGKAPIVIPSGKGEDQATVPLLLDLGVPAHAIRVEADSRNTVENARFTAALLKRLGCRRILLVTSAWHMRRAHLLFARTGLEVIPAATDHEATLVRATLDWSLPDLLPSPDALTRNTAILKEYIGYWVYRHSFHDTGFVGQPSEPSAQPTCPTP